MEVKILTHLLELSKPLDVFRCWKFIPHICTRKLLCSTVGLPPKTLETRSQELFFVEHPGCLQHCWNCHRGCRRSFEWYGGSQFQGDRLLVKDWNDLIWTLKLCSDCVVTIDVYHNLERGPPTRIPGKPPGLFHF